MFCILASILLVIDGYVQYNESIFNGSQDERDLFHCYVGTACSNLAIFICIWFSACIQLEHLLVLVSKNPFKITRKRSIIVSIGFIALGISSVTPLVYYKCAWKDIPGVKIFRMVLNGFHIVIPVFTYIISSILFLIVFARRIRTYGMENRCYIVTFVKLVYSHLFIFLPPLVYGICFGIFNIVANRSDSKKGYYHCTMTLPEYVVKLMLSSLRGIPFVFIWLIFVFPSRVYMTEFYMNTWCGQWSAWIVLRLRQRCCRKLKILQHVN
ncbi:unnamed protein product [Rotaria sp. Silwood1]|nr:unnamed protein product [Rotaria sp. Silwood1]